MVWQRFANTVWGGNAGADGAHAIDLKRTNEAGLLSSQHYPTLIPALVTEMTSHRKFVCPHKKGQKITLPGAHGTLKPECPPLSSSSPHQRVSGPRAGGRGGIAQWLWGTDLEVHAVTWMARAPEDGPLNDHNCGSGAVAAGQPGQMGAAKGKGLLCRKDRWSWVILQLIIWTKGRKMASAGLKRN